MTSRLNNGPLGRSIRKGLGSLVMAMALLTLTSSLAAAGVTLKLGDILVAEPGTSTISVIDPVTGTKTVVSQGGLLDPAHRAVAVALALNGDVIVVHRTTGLIRINPVTGAQSILSQGGFFKDPFAIAISKDTGEIFVADSSYDHDRPSINEAGKIIKVNAVSGAQTVVASGSACTSFPQNAACQNTTSAGSYISHPYGIAIDYSTSPDSLIVADMSSFNGKGAIVRVQISNGAQTLLWGPASASPAPVVAQATPLGCPMGVAVEPNGNILTTVFTYPVPPTPEIPPPAGTFYGCAPPGIFRVDLANHTQTVVNSNGPEREASHSYSVGSVVNDLSGHLHRATSAGISSSSTPNWNATIGGNTSDGTVVWQNIGRAANWLIPFGVDVEPNPSNPSQYNIVVGDEGYSMVFRLTSAGDFLAAPLTLDTSYVTSIDVITFTPQGGFTQPVRSNGQPSGILASGTTQTTISLSTAANATCRYSLTGGVAYSSMTNTFTTTGGTTHSRVVTGLANGNNYSYFVRCIDGAGNANTDDFVIAFSVANPGSIPSGAQANYAFSALSGTTIPNVVQGSGALPTLTVRGTDRRLSNGEIIWNEQINGFTHTFPFDPSHGTFAENVTTFPNAYSNGGTFAVRLRLASTVATLGQASGMGIITFRPDPDVNIHKVMPRGLELRRDGPTDPLYFLVREGNNSIGYNNEFNDEVRSGPISNPTADVTIIVVWDAQTLRLYVDGVLAGTTNRVTIDHPTPAYRLMVAVQPGLIHGGDRQFYEGALKHFLVYNRVLSGAEITSLNSALTFGTGGPPPGDTTAPSRSNGQPTGTLAMGTTQATLSLSTDENATCRYSQTPGVAYGSMTNTFTTTGSTAHSRVVTGLTNGGTYTFYVRCLDSAANANTDDYSIAFSVASTLVSTSSFSGVEGTLSENGMWDSPGAWADLQKNNGAFAVGLNAAGRLVAPSVSPDQYSQITYSQDPGSSSWVGVMTRVQGASNGSGYLVIAYGGEVRLYRTDDTGVLNFTMLASAAVDISAAPRRLRLESQGNNHKVHFNGTLLINHNASGTLYTSGQPGIAASVFGGPQVKILTFEGGDLGPPAPDTTPPLRSNGQPTATLPLGTTQATLSLTTSENATCRYSQTAGVSYGSMTNTFTTTGTTTHSRVVTGLTNGGNYTFYVRCVDGAANANPDDYAIAFSVANTLTTTSSFSGAENPLSENGVWDSPGSWADLRKNSGAFADGLNAAARLVAPALGPNQFSEITYSQDPGASSWVGVTTRTQGSNNGSGYLAIVYAGEVRLYRTDDSGGLNFTQLASASASLGTSPRRLRLESSGNNHKVYFNGTLLINHNASGTTYTAGQPGIAASVFGGPQVKILSFAGGELP